MRLPPALLLALFCTSLLLACGGRTTPGVPPGARKDKGPPAYTEAGPQSDTYVVPPRDFAVPGETWWPSDIHLPPPKDVSIPPTCVKLGHTCVASSSCCPGLSCTALDTGVQICSRGCTPDDPKTPLVNEDTCGWTHVCGSVTTPGKTYRCLQKCAPKASSNPCPKGLACHPSSPRYSGKISQAVCVYPACKTGKDCPVMLSETCDMATAVPKCTKMPKGAFCSPDGKGSTVGRCALDGVCNAASGLCGVHKRGKAAAKVADPCTDDRDCAGQMRCLMEEKQAGTVRQRNGYCTIEGCIFASTLSYRACSVGSTCSRYAYGGLCFRSCNLQQATTCRNHPGDKHGDYECRAWNNLSVGGGVVVSKTPVCEPGHWATCDLFGSAKLDCSYLGLYNKNNPTKMICRDPKSGKALPKGSPGGFCLDSTASGKPY